ncbi:hypothetical protein BJY52DRAFT_1106909, partial [Lactarius psammicola]
LLIRQSFGIATGKLCSFEADPALTFQDYAASGVYPICYGDGGLLESIKDLAERARIALTKFVLPHVWQAVKEGRTGIHVTTVSHGLCITESISKLLKRSKEKG